MGFWVQLIILVATTLISKALAPKPPKAKAFTLDDFDIPTAEDGRAVPVVFGTVKITGPNLVWYGDLNVHTQTYDGVKTRRYYMGQHFALCHGPIDCLHEIVVGERTAWSGQSTESGEIYINNADLFGGKFKEGGVLGYADLMMGESTQTANSYLTSAQGTPQPGYRGIASLVYRQGLISANSQYPKPWSFITQRTITGWYQDNPWYAYAAHPIVGDYVPAAAGLLAPTYSGLDYQYTHYMEDACVYNGRLIVTKRHHSGHTGTGPEGVYVMSTAGTLSDRHEPHPDHAAYRDDPFGCVTSDDGQTMYVIFGDNMYGTSGEPTLYVHKFVGGETTASSYWLAAKGSPGAVSAYTNRPFSIFRGDGVTGVQTTRTVGSFSGCGLGITLDDGTATSSGGFGGITGGRGSATWFDGCFFASSHDSRTTTTVPLFRSANTGTNKYSNSVGTTHLGTTITEIVNLYTSRDAYYDGWDLPVHVARTSDTSATKRLYLFAGGSSRLLYTTTALAASWSTLDIPGGLKVAHQNYLGETDDGKIYFIAMDDYHIAPGVSFTLLSVDEAGAFETLYTVSADSIAANFVGIDRVLPLGPIMERNERSQVIGAIVNFWADDTGYLGYHFYGGVRLYASGVAGDVTCYSPAHMIYECLTNPDWGAGLSTDVIDDTSFKAAADTFLAEGMGLSMQWLRQEPLSDFIQRIIDHAGAVLRQNPATGLLELEPLRGDYDASSLEVFDEDDIISVDTWERAGYGELVGEVVVRFTDGSSFDEASISVQNPAVIQSQNGVTSTTFEFPGITSQALAQRVAMRELKAASSPLARGVLRVNRTGWDKQPGDVIKVSWAKLGLSSVICRIASIQTGTVLDGTITVHVVEDVFGLPSSTYAGQVTTGWTDPGTVSDTAEGRLEEDTLDDVFRLTESGTFRFQEQ